MLDHSFAGSTSYIQSFLANNWKSFTDTLVGVTVDRIARVELVSSVETLQYCVLCVVFHSWVRYPLSLTKSCQYWTVRDSTVRQDAQLIGWRSQLCAVASFKTPLCSTSTELAYVPLFMYCWTGVTNTGGYIHKSRPGIFPLVGMTSVECFQRASYFIPRTCYHIMKVICILHTRNVCAFSSRSIYKSIDCRSIYLQVCCRFFCSVVQFGV